jgi:hypothetical protein
MLFASLLVLREANQISPLLVQGNISSEEKWLDHKPNQMPN